MHLSFRWRVTLTYVTLFIVALLLLSFALVSLFQQAYYREIQDDLLSKTRLVALQAAPLFQEAAPEKLLNPQAVHYRTAINARITFILPSGKVVGDSEADYLMMDNHASRPEVQQALKGLTGTDTRVSDTLKTELLYAAVPVINNNQVTGVVRLAIPIKNLNDNLNAMIGSVSGAAFLTLLFVVILAIILADRTIRPLQQLTAMVAGIRDGKLVQFTPSTRKDEIGQLSRVFADLTTQIDSQIKELTNQRARLEAVLAYMNEGILIIDTQGQVILHNPLMEKLFGVSFQDGAKYSLIEVVRHHQVMELWHKSQQSNKSQTILLETSPERLHIQVIATQFQGEFLGNTLLVFNDLTHQHRLETVRRDFISNISHELRTPLASIKSIADTLQEGALDDPPAAQRFLLRMENEIDNMTQLLRELLELSRIESGKVPLNRRRITPHELIKTAADRMQMQAERVGLMLKMDCPDTLPFVNVDPDRIGQVLVNLIHNSIKFTPPGGEITVSAFEDQKNMIFRVKDSGVGISPEDLPRIFERFYKADRSRSGGGTGLGLSIVRHLIETHGGRVWAESVLNKGSTFYFTIPLRIEIDN